MTMTSPDLELAASAPTEDELLTTWWSSLPAGRRRHLLSLRAGEPLPRPLATELWRLGVSSPLALIDDHGRQVRRSLPSPALLELLARAADPAVDTL